MCGIVGYIGKDNSLPILIEGLRKLEYRGYDSAGVAVHNGSDVIIKRKEGKVSALEDELRKEPLSGMTGIGHTRWATHGRPSEINAHPHRADDIVLVHNGIIENYLELKSELEAHGHTFSSETDTEVITRLVAEKLKAHPDLFSAVKSALKRVKGSYAIAVFRESDPSSLIAARKGSPLILGIGQGEQYIASDIPAILWRTREVKYLEDGDVALLTEKGITIYDENDKITERKTTIINWDPVMAEKGGYRHFMLKEIHEQPRALTDTLGPRIKEMGEEIYLEDLNLSPEKVRSIKKIFIVSCGTSWHAALVGKFLIEGLARVPVEVDIASEFRYRNPIIEKGDLVIAVSQSGETADTFAAVREAKQKGATTITVCNVVASSIARETDGVIYTHAGPEIGVASTKAFTTQMGALYLLALHLSAERSVLSSQDYARHITGLKHLPALVEETLQTEKLIEDIAREYSKFRDFLFLGRGINYPIALEGALKLKEISYIHAEGYPVGEMKHGPIALIDENMPVVVLAPSDDLYDKVLAGVEEVKARDGRVIAIVSEGDKDIVQRADHSIVIPKADKCLNPFLLSIPLQFLAYHVAVHLGTDVDQPRNLAKSVTVE
ncbi:MAG: glutamine--fructose-6-phosphate transaminase (isomerizing) [Proteobacteria bacterium]|nr:glutamine--fructose-6-phosphate transaminase (isomerizing) [Pseudomonadota bacterium]